MKPCPAPGDRCARESGSQFPPSSCLWTVSTLSSEMGPLFWKIQKLCFPLCWPDSLQPPRASWALWAVLTARGPSLPAMEPPGPLSGTSAPSAWSFQPPLTPPLPPLQDLGPLQHMAAQGTSLVSSVCSSLRPRSKSQDSRRVGLDMERAWSSWDKGRRLMTRTCSFAGSRGLSLTQAARGPRPVPGTLPGPCWASGVSPPLPTPPSPPSSPPWAY